MDPTAESHCATSCSEDFIFLNVFHLNPSETCLTCLCHSLTTEQRLVASVRGGQGAEALLPLVHNAAQVARVAQAAHRHALQVHGLQEVAQQRPLQAQDVPSEGRGVRERGQVGGWGRERRRRGVDERKMETGGRGGVCGKRGRDRGRTRERWTESFSDS